MYRAICRLKRMSLMATAHTRKKMNNPHCNNLKTDQNSVTIFLFVCIQGKCGDIFSHKLSDLIEFQFSCI